MYTTHAAFGFMLLAVAYFVSFQIVTGGRAPRYRAIGVCIYAELTLVLVTHRESSRRGSKPCRVTLGFPATTQL